MNGRGFLTRLVLIVLAITNTEAVMTFALFYLVMTPSASEFLIMLRTPIVDVAVINAVFLVIVFLLARPVMLFLDGRVTEVAAIQRVRDRGMNLPYVLAFLSAAFFIFGTTVITWRSLRALSWPPETVTYGFLSGVICGLLAVPLYVYSLNWLIAPVLRQTTVGETEAAFSVGRRVSIRLKLVATVVLIVGAATGYTAVVGYSQTRKVIDEYQTVAADSAAGPRHSPDAAVKSLAVRERGLAVFYLLLWLAAVGVSGLVAFAAAREMTAPIQALRGAADRVRAGIYAEPVRMLSNDELGELAIALNRMMDTITSQMQSLREVMAELKAGIERIDDSVRTIHEVSSEQASGATQQASVVQESSAVAQEIVITARQISEKARNVDHDAESTVGACRQGESLLARAEASFNEISVEAERNRAAMRELHDRFQKTYKIVEFIEEVADQTELLALNASLEAAGAGESGRRFSVVAEAVHQLAVRSAQSAGQIRDLINVIENATDESIRRAEAGKARVEEGGQVIAMIMESLHVILDFAAGTSRSAKEISLSTDQQSSASEMLAQSITEVSDVAGRVEDGARQIQSAIAELKTFADSLRATVAK